MADGLYSISFHGIGGEEVPLEVHRGKVLLLVNVASRCGYTPQYRGLEALWRKYRGQGLVVLGFPCNQFAQEEPGSGREILDFCRSRYEVSFPLSRKIEVLEGPGQDPLYRHLTRESPFPGEVEWNFAKFLAGRGGGVVARFKPDLDPESPALAGAVEQALRA